MENKTKVETNSLLEVIKKNDLNEALKLIQDGTDVNQPLLTPGPLVGKSFLYVAALLDNCEAVELLLESGAVITLGIEKDKDLTSSKSNEKIDCGNPESSQNYTLRAANAELCPLDPVCGNSNGNILKLMSCYDNNIKYISLLTQEELKTVQPHFNLLQYYCTWNYSHISPERKRHFVRTLVQDIDIDVNYCPYQGLTALYIACKYHTSPAVVEELLQLGARVNDDVDGIKPIDVLLECESDENANETEEEYMDNIVELFKLLLKYGSSINHKCFSRKKASYITMEPSDKDPLQPSTILSRICENDKFSPKNLEQFTQALDVAGYNFSRDYFLIKESQLVKSKLKEDLKFHEELLENVRNPVTLSKQCRRIIVGAIGDPYWSNVLSLEKFGVPSLIMDYLHFCDI